MHDKNDENEKRTKPIDTQRISGFILCLRRSKSANDRMTKILINKTPGTFPADRHGDPGGDSFVGKQDVSVILERKGCDNDSADTPA